MNRAGLLGMSLTAALWAAACSNSGTTITPPPPNNGFSNSNLSGQYAFSMSGTAFDPTTGASVPFTRAGSFTADGKGNISGGVEDFNLNFASSGSGRLAFTGGSYTINSDGRGTLNLIDSSGTLAFSVTLASSSAGYIIFTPPDASATASGSFVLQNPGSFSLSGVTGSYTFDFSGVDPSGFPESIVGEFQANASGQLPTGLADDNDGGTINNSSAGPLAISGTYAADGTNPGDLSAFGRGSFAIGSLTGVFYVVGPNQVKFMETSSGGTLAGDAMLQANIPTTAAGINSSFVYVMGGASVSGTGISGPLTRGGKFAASGGNLSTIYVDNNNSGTLLSLSPTNGTSTGTYTVDSSGTGRGTITFSASGQKNPFQYVFYMISPTQAVVQDQSLAIVEDGSMLAQANNAMPVALSSLAGNYAINWSGVTVVNGGNSAGEEDLLGEATLSNAGAVTGTVDFNEFASLNKPEQSDIGVTGMLPLSGDGTNHNALTINLATNPANNGITAFAYIANNNTILLMTTQTVRFAAGVMTPQNP